MVKVPVVAFRFTETFIVELPVPPLIEDGLKLMLVPLPCPEAASEIEETYPALTTVVMAEFPDDPLLTVRAVGLAEMVKAAGIAVMVMLTVVLAVVPSVPVPVTVTLNVPVCAVLVAVNVSVVLPDAPI